MDTRYPPNHPAHSEGLLRAAAVQRELARQQPLMFSKAALMSYGDTNWTSSYRLTRDHDEAWRRLWTMYSKQTMEGGVNGGDYASLPNIQIATVGSALWCDCGFPQVVVGHKQCATLLSSRIADEVLTDLRAPWPAFYIEIPRGLIFVSNDVDGTLTTATAMLVINHTQFSPPRWSYIAFTEASLTLWQHGIQSRQLCSSTLENSSYDTTPYSEAITDVDARAQELLGRLVAGVCLSMSDPARYTDKGASKPHAPSNRRESSEPRTRTYVLKTTTTVDCRDAVADYARGGASSVPKVQVMVAGHWRHQPHGPGSKLRKLIHIEPYWKNGADLPILVKPHRL